LLGHYKLSALEVSPRLREQYHDLQRENVVSVQVLMQAVVVAGAVLQ
jgi:hypothetical protein